MTDILLSGALGRMGHAVADAAAGSPASYRIVAGVDIHAGTDLTSPFPIYDKIADFPGGADVIVDFSHHTALPGLIACAEKYRMGIVASTTGYTPEELALMREAAKKIPIFYSRNMSVGVNLLIELAKQAATVLQDTYDIEIVEAHHNKKLDAPSGTALMLADAIAEVLPEKPDYVYDRHTESKARTKREIGIHSIRGGTIVGEHEVLFCGDNEVIKLSHSAGSRAVFAAGAIAAAGFLKGKPAGLYNMGDLIRGAI